MGVKTDLEKITRDWLRASGLRADIASGYRSCRNRATQFDLFGIFDIIAYSALFTIGIQVTDTAHRNNRLSKLLDSDDAKAWAAPYRQCFLITWNTSIPLSGQEPRVEELRRYNGDWRLADVAGRI